MRGTALDNIGAIGGITGSSMLAILTHRVWPIGRERSEQSSTVSTG